MAKTAFLPPRLIGLENSDRLASANNRFYRIYMAQAINVYMRPSITNASLSMFTAIAPDDSHILVKQDEVSKILLQVLLGVFILFVVAAYAMTRVRNVLPHNPCTIAGTMNLLAGSQTSRGGVLPEGAEWISEKDLRRNGGLDGWKVSLGWWGYEEGRRCGVDVGRAEMAG